MIELHLIVTIRWAGSILVQGRTVEPIDGRGFVKSDMQGRVSVQVGDKVFSGKPVERVAHG